MSLLTRLRSAFSGRREEKAERASASADTAFLVFSDTGEVIRAERLLKNAGLDVRVMAPPPALRTGCDMVPVVSLMHVFRAETVLERHGLSPLRVVPVGEALLEPVSLFQTKDYGDWIMVRAANMKVTADKATGRIVNVSGGGCPDVPYLAARLIGQSIFEADPAGEHGQTLCGYALHLAVRELRGQWADAGSTADG